MPWIATVAALVTNGVAFGTALTATIGWAGAFAVQLGGSLLFSAASQALKGKPKMGGVKAANVSLRAPVSPRDLVYGRVRKGGVIIFPFTRPNNKSVMDLVIVLASHRVEKIGAIYFNGKPVVMDGQTEPAAGRYVGQVQVVRALGGAEQSAFGSLAETYPDKWSDAHRLQGCAAIRLILTFDGDAFPNGLPNISADIWGKNDILDPRSGTRGYSANAALCVADYMTLDPFGLGASIGGDIDQLDLIEAANICDEVVSKRGGGVERRFECNGVVSLDAAPQEIIQAMLTAMGGRVYWSGRSFRIRAAAWRAADLALSEDDAGPGGFRLQTRQSMADNFNGVRGQFVSPENDWQPDDFPAYQSDYYVAEDNGEERWQDIALPFTTSSSAAQRLAKIELERQRRQQVVTMTGKFSAWAATAGDTVALSRARTGWTNKPFVVERVRLALASGALQPVLTLREASPLVYSWAATEEQIYAAAPRTDLPNAFDIDPPGIMSVTESLYVTRDGDGVKARVEMTLMASPSLGVASYIVRGRINGGAWTIRSQNSAETIVEILDVAPGLWEFQARAVNQIGVRSDWSDVFEVTVEGLGAAPSEITGAAILSMGGNALLKWDQHPDLDVRIGGAILIRHSSSTVPTWGNATFVGAVAGASSSRVVPLLPGTYLLRARDSSGVVGPVVTLATLGIQAQRFSPVGSVVEDPVFGGAVLNVVDRDGGLTLGGAGDIWDGIDIYTPLDVWNPTGSLPLRGVYTFVTGLDFRTAKAVRLRRVVEMTPYYIGADIYAPANIWAVSDVWQAAPDEVDVRVEIATTTDNPAASPVWSDWRLLEADEVYARGVKARAILTTTNPLVAPLVNKLRIEAHEVV